MPGKKIFVLVCGVKLKLMICIGNPRWPPRWPPMTPMGQVFDCGKIKFIN